MTTPHPPARPVALVTGATAGIGLAFARALAARGHDLVLVSRTEERLRQVGDELHARYGCAVEVLPADLSVRDDVEVVAQRLRDDARPVEVLVNNAGYGLGQGFLANPVQDEEDLVAVLVRAVLVLSHAAATTMTARGSGAVVNVSSIASFAQVGTYSAAKAWVTVFTEGLANELRGTGVTATALCPGFTRTEFHDRAHMDMAALPAIAWLDADELVRQCLDDVVRGRVLSVPGALYRAIRLGTHVLPRTVTRRVSGALSQARADRS